MYATQQATSSPQPNRSPLHACHNVTTSQHPAHSTSNLCKVPPQAAQHQQQQPPADMHPSHSFEYDLPTQGQGTQNKGSQQQQQPPVLAKQESMSEAAPARYGVRLVDQHVHPRDGRDLGQQPGSQACQATRSGTPIDHQQPTHQHEQQQQHLVSWGALGPASAAQVHAGAAVGQTARSGSEGLMQALQGLHQQPPWDGLTVCLT